MIDRAPERAYSAHVELTLVVGARRLRVGQVGGNSLILREPAEIAPKTPAKLIVSIDHEEDIDDIILSDGVSGCNVEFTRAPSRN